MKKGFTLVEMLIVIAVIGVLAVAVLSAINPIEQMRKARDTRRKSNAAELMNAVERYYATNEENPPALALSGVAGSDDNCAAALSAGNISPTDLIDLVEANELKSNFTERIGNTSDFLYVGFDPTSDLVAVCFQIESDANIQKYSGATNYCTSLGDHYICVPE